MKTGLVQDTTNSAKSLAQQIAKQMAREPLEVLKDAREQTTGEAPDASGKSNPNQSTDDQKRLIEHQNDLQDKMKSTRRMEALQREIDDIHRQKVFKDLQNRIAQGEEIALEEYPELSLDQKQVLRAQMEAVKQQKQAQAASFQEAPTIHSKPSRRFGAGQKQEAEKQQTRVEKPVPPSG